MLRHITHVNKHKILHPYIHVYIMPKCVYFGYSDTSHIETFLFLPGGTSLYPKFTVHIKVYTCTNHQGRSVIPLTLTEDTASFIPIVWNVVEPWLAIWEVCTRNKLLPTRVRSVKIYAMFLSNKKIACKGIPSEALVKRFVDATSKANICNRNRPEFRDSIAGAQIRVPVGSSVIPGRLEDEHLFSIGVADMHVATS